MKISLKKSVFVFGLLFVFLLANFSQIVYANEISRLSEKSSSDISKWTYVCYASWDAYLGKNLLKNDSGRLIDIMSKVGSDQDINIVMLLDTMFPNDETRFYYFGGENITNLSWDEVDSDMGNKDTLVKCLKRVKEDFPSEHLILNINSPRGMSWQGICLDDDTAKSRTQSLFGKKYIDMPEFSSALREITNNGREKIDVIEFTTCITGSLEVAYQVSPFADYMVASEENMQSFTSNYEYSWPLNKSLSYLKHNTDLTPEEYAKCVVNNFNAGKNTSAYLGCAPFNKKTNIPVDTTLSATNLSKINRLAISVNELSLSLIDNIDEYKGVIKEARYEARKFGPWYPRTRLGYSMYLPKIRELLWKFDIPFFKDVWVDIYHFSELLYKKINSNNSEAERIKDACNQVMCSINDTIIANNVSEGDNAHGLHVYFPPNAVKHNQHLWLIGFPTLLISKSGYACYEATDFARATSWNEMLYETYNIPDYLVQAWLKSKETVL